MFERLEDLYDAREPHDAENSDEAPRTCPDARNQAGFGVDAPIGRCKKVRGEGAKVRRKNARARFEIYTHSSGVWEQNSGGGVWGQ